MVFIDQGKFEAMKTLSGRRAPHCDKHQFRAKRKKERRIEKWHFHDHTLLCLAVFRMAFGTYLSLADHKGTQRGRLGV